MSHSPTGLQDRDVTQHKGRMTAQPGMHCWFCGSVAQEKFISTNTEVIIFKSIFKMPLYAC